MVDGLGVTGALSQKGPRKAEQLAWQSCDLGPGGELQLDLAQKGRWPHLLFRELN